MFLTEFVDKIRGKKNLSDDERATLIDFARESGMSDGEILRLVASGYFSRKTKTALAVEWGKLMGYGISDSLSLARSSGLFRRADLSPELQVALDKEMGKNAEE